MKSLIRKHQGLWMTILCLIIYCIVLRIFEITCPIKYLTGISCPGCGMTRAVQNAMNFKFNIAFYYHPLWILLPIIVIMLYGFYLKKMRKTFNIALIVITMIFIFVYLVRIFDGNNEIVSFEPQNGLIYKTFKNN